MPTIQEKLLRCIAHGDLLYSAHPWAPPLRGRRRFSPTFKFSPGEFVTFHVQVGHIIKNVK